VSPSGEITEGVYVAESESRLKRDLEERGLHVLALKPKGGIAGLSLGLPRRTRVGTADFLVFNQELATLLKAGMPLVQSLDLLRRRAESEVFRRVLDDVYDRVRAGAALSDAFAAHGSLFPGVYTASLLAGERSGSLDIVLCRFVEYSKVVANVKRKTVSALVYPAILISLSIVLVSIIVLKVVPAFTDFYESFGSELPLSTRVIVGISTVLREQAVPLLIGLALGIAAFAVWLRQPGRRMQLDRVFLTLPMAGDVARKFATSQISRTLSTLLAGGLPLVNAIDIATRSVGNRFMAGELEAVGVRVREGQSFASALDARRVFPDVAVRMAEVGESTGALQEMLATVADFFDEDIATRMERFVTLVEPVLLVIMGIVIAGLLLALYLPLFQLSSVLQ
jgi:type IV pilus assembly protein PilC